MNNKSNTILVADYSKPYIMGHFISESVCDEVITYFENPSTEKFKGISFKDGQVSSDRFIKSSTECLFNFNDCREYFHELSKVVEKYVTLFPETFDRLQEWDITEACKIQKYSPPDDAYHNLHCEEDGGGRRHLVFMTYLNSVSDGGETFFPQQNFICKPQKGLTLIWPANFNYTHKGFPSLTQTKYIATGWFSFLEPKNNV